MTDLMIVYESSIFGTTGFKSLSHGNYVKLHTVQQDLYRKKDKACARQARKDYCCIETTTHAPYSRNMHCRLLSSKT
jgi:hypothetical protein